MCIHPNPLRRKGVVLIQLGNIALIVALPEVWFSYQFWQMNTDQITSRIVIYSDYWRVGGEHLVHPLVRPTESRNDRKLDILLLHT